ncbi:MAG: transposase family protein [Anaerolineales bacterium]|nr:transposase family protein [Anaerolineales bacterium]
MSDPQAELKARLMAQAEAAIEQMLAQRVAPAKASLADIERVTRTTGELFEQASVTELVAASGTAFSNWPVCPECGQKMKYKGSRRRRMVTETGEVALQRAYYHCAACKCGVFPPR